MIASAHRRKRASRSLHLGRVAWMTASVASCLPQVVSAADSRELETVVVTAQRREEKLLDTPISIGVLQPEQIESGNNRSVLDVLNRVSGVSLIEERPGDSQIAIRGVIGSRDGGSSAVGYYMDEAPFAFINSARIPDTGAYDLSRIEVLRGPQGTLYGASALAGVVRVLTNDPEVDQFGASGRLRGSMTEHSNGSSSGDFMVNAPLVEGKLAIRAVAGYSDQGAFITGRDGRKGNDAAIQNYRVKLAYEPTNDLKIILGYTRNEIDLGANNNALDDYSTTQLSRVPTKAVMDIYSGVLNYDLPGVSILSATSFIDYRTHSISDLIAFTFINAMEHHAFNQEIRLSSNSDGPLRWTAGGFYRKAREGGFQDARPILPGVLSVNTTSKSFAGFGEVGYSFTDTLELTGGLRYFHDRQTQTQVSGFFPTAPLAPVSSRTYEKVTWRGVVTYKPSSDLTFYASASTGFRSGREQSASALVADPTFPSVNPDTILNYEVGSKGNLGGGFSYDLALYHIKWDEIQQTIQLGAPFNFQAYVNAGSASGFGVDGSLNYRSGGFEAYASLSWNGLEYDQTTTSGSTAQPVFLKGSRVNDSPAWTGSIGASYRAPTGMSDVDFYFGGDFSFGSTRLSRTLAGASVAVGSSDTVQYSSVRLGLDGERWGVEAFVDNVLDYDGKVQPPIRGLGGIAQRMRPRTYGLQTSFSF